MKNLLYEVSTADDWSNLFVQTDGWFGGDGIFAIPMSSKPPDQDTVRHLIIFSDTMLGLISDGVLQKGYRMVNNSVAILDGLDPLKTRINFPVHKNEDGKEVSIFPVNLPDKEGGEYYWLGDGFLNPETNAIHIFAYTVIDRPESTELFKFEIVGGAIITIPADSKFPYAEQVQTELPFFENQGGWVTSFGAGIFENTNKQQAGADGYIYIYGVRDPNKQVLVGRVKPEDFLTFDQWTFWQKDHWGSDFRESTSIADSASNELSVSQLPGGKYGLVFQLNGIYPTVGMRLGDSPAGPFGEILNLWDCTDDLVEPEFFAYNAKAHPTLSKANELLISYNINSFAFWNQIETHPHLYRPRFIKLVFREK